MEPHFERLFSIAKAILHELRTEKISFLAGSIAYHAFVSLLPLLLLTLVVISIVGNQDLRASFISLVGAVLTANAGDILIQELRNASTGVSLLGLVLLLWGTLRIFRGLDTAFSDIYESESQNTIADQFIDGVLVFATFGLAIGVTWGINTLLLGFGSSPFLWVLRRIVLIAGLSVTLFPIYYVFPDIDLTVREVIPGILVAAIGLMAFESLFRFYTQFRSPDGGSAIAGILLLVTWLYFSGLVILLGVIVNAVLTNRSQDISIDPVIGGVEPPHQQRDSAARKQLISNLREAENNIAGAGRLVITADDTNVHLPPPRHVTTDIEESNFTLGDGAVSLELQWTPKEIIKE
jgi:membrane protein